MPGIHFHATGDPHHHHHDHHDHDHHDHDHDHHDHGHGDHAHGFGDAASFGEPSALVRFLMSNYLAVMAVVVLVSLVLLLLRRRASRPRSRPDAGTDYGKEAQMNLAVRRARALEAMQAEYDAKARQWEELQAKKRELEAEERARRVAAAPLMGPVGGGGGGGGGGAGGSGGGGGGGSNVVEWSPLMGSGPVGGFKSNRCTRRGG